jgi:hypothetical protein
MGGFVISPEVNDEVIRRNMIPSPELEMSVRQTTDHATSETYPARYLAARWYQPPVQPCDSKA